MVPVENVALETGWGKCTGCREVFPLHEVLDGFRIPTFGPVDSFPERPFDAWIIVDHPDEQSMAVLEIVHRSGAFSLACDTDDERQWLISEINRFLGHAGPASGTQSLS